jgi:hypothetical protein
MLQEIKNLRDADLRGKAGFSCNLPQKTTTSLSQIWERVRVRVAGSRLHGIDFYNSMHSRRNKRRRK